MSKRGYEQQVLEQHTPKTFAETRLTGCWRKIPDSFVDVLLPNVSPEVFYLILYVWKYTDGKDDKHTTYKRLSFEGIGKNFGLKGITSKRPGLGRNAVMRHMRWAVDEGLIVSRNWKADAGIKSANSYGIGPELVSLIKTGDFTQKFRARNNVTTKPGEPSLKKGTHHTIGSAFFQLPWSFEDLVATNIPSSLYVLLVYVWRNTQGRWNKWDGLPGTPLSMRNIGRMAGVKANQARSLIGWARDNDILEVEYRRNDKGVGATANSYRPGNQVWYMVNNGDFTTGFIKRLRVQTEPSKPARYKK